MQSSSKRNFPKGDRVTAAAGKKSIFQSRPRRPPHPRIFNSSPDVNETQPGGTNDRRQRQSASFGRRNHNFDPELYTLGVIVFASWKKADSAVGTSNDSSVPKNEYMVFPFCTGKAQPRELTLRCPELHKLGEWIRIENRDLQGGQVNPKTYQPHDEWFLTMPFLKSVAMECDILVFARIRTKTYKPNKPSKMPPVPFIQGIEDDLGLLQREHADMKVCATIVYQSGRWRIRHLKPRGFYQFY